MLKQVLVVSYLITVVSRFVLNNHGQTLLMTSLDGAPIIPDNLKIYELVQLTQLQVLMLTLHYQALMRRTQSTRSNLR